MDSADWSDSVSVISPSTEKATRYVLPRTHLLDRPQGFKGVPIGFFGAICILALGRKPATR
jgi:hypothetical protein